ncbi:MAG: hypothetical protein A3B74_00250 [Candidatus Kerfeldbacteria bacterium RIFCSPHIGHO2_02_FULL_42_14]|uniref:Thioredoxin domain-containing protein n=1 Tax=Candidatus Kerfeldbacteria bacterium RIFCSPHIGHO2_02_FULL_42_14 TaxID=1798540 RepID=A0A1G2ATC0_9BACT|nr:MAG: hypothetical protein A3B74_00250 [Candidatus Kerfeldbacteria bacterium RIFCSPHIGHO2_02_FULL_42_14]OGY81293.1 MAG: hypothetical protein A3E60_02480 [Candidatus Kerfeldbacteria bacterium RIFCSPHIGHO2_12_FULL_42_13]OGY83568.1 MAG: hypothetical protein A3I91_02915 [Candidatus Kerfeldbacteria bacterium RIFCSPLOWO2_02_FULL_42_19]OGY86716.1 MAG: hypothetical protein A3G01_00705 [Candidatus Kerfeldbacteria bacterium RIFCSPLOWO2_12_FULL_43_9]
MEVARMFRPWYKRWWGLLIVFVFSILILFLTVFSLLTFSVYRGLKKGTFNYERYFGSAVSSDINALGERQLPVDVSVDDDPATGNLIDPKVVIIAFEDFQCPFCGEAFPTVKEIVKLYGDEIQFVYRDFPVSSIHEDAQKAAEAAECAEDQGKFWEMHDMIYLNQDTMRVADLKRFAADLSLDMATFGRCLDSGQYEEEVRNDLRDGIIAGVTGTPTFFMNGFKIAGAVPLDILKRLIEAEIARQTSLEFMNRPDVSEPVNTSAP